MAHVLVKNLSANSFGQVVHVINNVLLVPLYLASWGVERYGEWLVLVAVPAYFMATADAGFVPVCGNDMTMEFARGRRGEVLKIFQSGWIFTSALSVVVVGGVGGTAGIMGINRLLGLMTITRGEAECALLCLLLLWLLNFQQGMVQVALRAVGRYAEGTFAVNAAGLLEAGAVAVGLLLGGGPAAVAAILLAIRLGTIAMTALLLRHHAPWLRHGVAKASWSEIKRLLTPSVIYLAFPAGNAAMLQGVTLILNHALGSAAVALYVTTRTLARFVTQLISLTSWASWPEISRQYGAGRSDLLGEFLTHGTQLAAILGASFALVVNAGARFIFAIWTDGRIEADRRLVALLTLAAVATTLRAFPDTIIKATNRHMRYGGWYLAASVAAAVAVYPATLVMNVAGAAVAVAVGEIALLVLSASTAKTLIGEGWAPLRRVLTTRPPIERLFQRPGSVQNVPAGPGP
jgi:O-antigen/teichoic acid export membrane protein